MRIKYLALIMFLVPAASGCFGTKPSTEPICLGETVSVNGPLDKLGSATRFNEELSQIVERRGEVTMGELTRAAGWSDAWDRVVDVYGGIDAADLSRAAQSGPAAECWRGLPTRGSSSSDRPAQGFYLFLSGGKLVQKVLWSADRKWIEMGRGVGLTPESLLVTDPTRHILVPAG
ncbi:hypothetical protein [Nocardia sp. NPDC005366]|uniref:hypothetical protein n=1 Tax=Nocardia sp. NPDC005366 TaxID=3156878 RepID=UPI0033A37A94